MTVIDPDSFLETGNGRVWTPERNAEAWQCAFRQLDETLSLDAGSPLRVVVVCGLQGAGKTTWIAGQVFDSRTIYFDAALPGARHREPIVAIAHAHGIAIEAVWIRVPIMVALERNMLRPADQIVPEASIRSVAAAFEPPSVSEGFDRVTLVDNSDRSSANRMTAIG